MTNKPFIFLISAVIGLSVGGALSRINRLDNLTGKLKVANAKLESSLDSTYTLAPQEREPKNDADKVPVTHQPPVGWSGRTANAQFAADNTAVRDNSAEAAPSEKINISAIEPLGAEVPPFYMPSKDSTKKELRATTNRLVIAPKNSLPIALSAFTVEANEGSVRISWSIIPDSRTNYFAIERSLSAAGGEWVKLDSVTADLSASNYGFRDDGAPRGSSCYRLRIEASDGTHSFSHVKSVSVKVAPTSGDGSSGIQLYPPYPNPAQETVTIELSATVRGAASIINQSGRTVWSASLVKGRVVADVRKLPPGVYRVLVSYGSTQEVRQLVLVE